MRRGVKIAMFTLAGAAMVLTIGGIASAAMGDDKRKPGPDPGGGGGGGGGDVPDPFNPGKAPSGTGTASQESTAGTLLGGRIYLTGHDREARIQAIMEIDKAGRTGVYKWMTLEQVMDVFPEQFAEELRVSPLTLIATQPSFRKGDKATRMDFPPVPIESLPEAVQQLADSAGWGGGE